MKNEVLDDLRTRPFLIELIGVLDSMPIKELIGSYYEYNGFHDALGCVGVSRKLNVVDWFGKTDAYVAGILNISVYLHDQITKANDIVDCEEFDTYRPQRWASVREWAIDMLKSNPV